MGRRPKQIILTESEQNLLEKVLNDDPGEIRSWERAKLIEALLSGDSIKNISDTWGISTATVSNIKRRFFEDGLERALFDLPRSGAPKSIPLQVEIDILALASSAPPEPTNQWTLRLLAKIAVERGLIKTISHSQIGDILKKHNHQLARKQKREK